MDYLTDVLSRLPCMLAKDSITLNSGQLAQNPQRQARANDEPAAAKIHAGRLRPRLCFITSCMFLAIWIISSVTCEFNADSKIEREPQMDADQHGSLKSNREQPQEWSRISPKSSEIRVYLCSSVVQFSKQSCIKLWPALGYPKSALS